MVSRRCGNTMTGVSLIAIDPNGAPREFRGKLTAEMAAVLRQTNDFYKLVGFEEPWICYLALADQTPVGTCAFKSPPRNNRVEIAYCTFPEHEGHGFATAMARQLVSLARQHQSSLVIAAQTLPQRNASHRVLEKLGFRHVETIDHPEDGMVWEWQLPTGNEALTLEDQP